MPPAVSSPAPAFPNVGQSVLLVLGVLFIQVAGGATVALVATLAGGASIVPLVLFNPATLIAINLLAIGIVLALGFRVTRESARAFFTVQPFALRLLPAIVLCSVGLAIVLAEVDNILVELLQAFSVGTGVPTNLLDVARFPASGFLLLVIVAPFTEEYLFRGMILRGLLTRHRAAVAIVLTSILFGLIHANPRQLLLGVAIGGVFGWWYLRTRSIGPCLIGHAVFNAVAWCTMAMPGGVPPFVNTPPGGPILHQPWWFTITGVVATGIALAWFNQSAPPATSPAPEAEPPLLG